MSSPLPLHEGLPGKTYNFSGYVASIVSLFEISANRIVLCSATGRQFIVVWIYLFHVWLCWDGSEKLIHNRFLSTRYYVVSVSVSLCSFYGGKLLLVGGRINLSMGLDMFHGELDLMAYFFFFPC